MVLSDIGVTFVKRDKAMIAKRRRYHLISINAQDPILKLNSRYSILDFAYECPC
jgi:hypothetical protein